MHQLAPLPYCSPEALEALEAAAERATHARARNTIRAYTSDLADFDAFCVHMAFPPSISAPVVCAYVDQLARRGAKVSTIRRRLAALNARLRGQNLPALSLREEPLASVMRGIRREVGEAKRQAKPMDLEAIRAALAATGEGPAALRDRALLLIGFAGALRRSEVAGLDWAAEDSPRVSDDNPKGAAGFAEVVGEGLRIILWRSKTNQTGETEEVAICRGAYAATCPVRALEAWRAAVEEQAGEARGPLLRAVDRHGRISDERMVGGSVARIVKRAAKRAAAAEGASIEEVEAAIERMSGHSLRAGLVTTGFAAGLTAEDVKRQTRHRDINVLLEYRRHATAFVANVSGRIGL